MLFVDGLGQVEVGGIWNFFGLVEHKAWEHRLLEAAEYKEESSCFDYGCDPA
jgi:hypothetical protein